MKTRQGARVSLSAGLTSALLSVLALGMSTGASAQTLTNLHSFAGGRDGINPRAGLVGDASGALYGTTAGGGLANSGTVFKLTPQKGAARAWTESVLYSFTGGSDGAEPKATLIVDASGALYGTTAGGGTANGGTVFKLTPPAVAGRAWIESVLYSFTGGSDGGDPEAALIADASGVLYGTTAFGGTADLGTVFELTPPAVSGGAWIEDVLHSFSGSDGANPFASLIFDASGALIGTTFFGGAADIGTVFRLTPPTVAGGVWTESVLRSFIGGDMALFPRTALIADASGALLGTTPAGGIFRHGTAFKLTPPTVAGGAWTESLLLSFPLGVDGGEPEAALIADTSGALYGTTAFGGVPADLGIVFKLTPPAVAGGDWTESVLHSFSGSDGARPMAALIADASGALFGTTSGDDVSFGTVFKLRPPATFAGLPGQPDCRGQSIAALANAFGGIAHAATALGYDDVADLQNAVAAFCGS